MTDTITMDAEGNIFPKLRHKMKTAGMPDEYRQAMLAYDLIWRMTYGKPEADLNRTESADLRNDIYANLHTLGQYIERHICGSDLKKVSEIFEIDFENLEQLRSDNTKKEGDNGN